MTLRPNASTRTEAAQTPAQQHLAAVRSFLHTEAGGAGRPADRHGRRPGVGQLSVGAGYDALWESQLSLRR